MLNGRGRVVLLRGAGNACDGLKGKVRGGGGRLRVVCATRVCRLALIGPTPPPLYLQPSVDTAKPATDRHRKAGHHAGELRLGCGGLNRSSEHPRRLNNAPREHVDYERDIYQATSRHTFVSGRKLGWRPAR